MLNNSQDKELTKEDVISFLKAVDLDLEGLQRKLKLYCLGGTQLVLSNKRSVSKDIDFIVPSDDWLMLSGSVGRLGYEKAIRFDVFLDGQLPTYKYSAYATHAKRFPVSFKHLEVYYLDDLDFILTKALSARSTDYEDIHLLNVNKDNVPKEGLIERFQNVKPNKGKENEVKSKFELFISEFYKK